MGFWAVIGAGWRGTFGAIKANPWPFVALLLGVVVLKALLHLADPVHYVQSLSRTADPVMVSSMTAVHQVARGAVFYLFFSLIATPCMVAVHRHMLLEEDRRIWENPQRLVVFAIFFFSMRFVLFSLPSLLTVLSHWFGLIYIVSLWLVVRLALTFPAAALDDSTPLASSWRYTSEHWFFAAGVMLFGLGPVTLMSVPFSIAIIHATPETAIRLYNALTVATTVSGLFYATVGAGLAAELFRKFGNAPVIG